MVLSGLEEKVAESVDRALLMRHVEEISKYVRLSGEPGEREAFEYIAHVLRGYGFVTELLMHDAYISLPGPAALEVLSPAKRAIECITHAFGQSTPPQGVVAELVYAGDGSEQSYAGLDVTNKFVLLDGMASPGAAGIATKMGALGQVHTGVPDGQMHEMIVSNVWGNPDDETKANLPRTFVLSIAFSEGEVLRQALAAGPVRIRAKASVSTRWTKIPLLVASIKPPERRGTEPAGAEPAGIERAGAEPSGAERDTFLLLSGHLDSWYRGAMDNGSANATMIEVARVIAENRAQLRRGLRLCFWSGHSHGRYAGSAYYVDNHWEDLERNCILHLNTDSTGAVGATNLLDANVMAETRGLAAHAVGAVTGGAFRGRRMSRNGDQSFWGAGIPSLFVSLSQQGPGPGGGGGLGWWWHTCHDTPDKIAPDFLVRDTKVYAVVAARVLTSALLPLDYSACAREWVDELEALASKAGARFDLNAIVARAKSFRERAERLQQAAGRAEVACSPHAAEAINKCLVRLGRVLIPVSYTRAGRFAHDPALDVHPLPDIADAARLGQVAEGSDEEKFLKVRLQRGSNRTLAALKDATALVDEALDIIEKGE